VKKLTKVIISYKNKETDIKEFYYHNDEIGFLIKKFFEMKKVIDDNVNRLKHSASHDSLTKIYNRKAFFEISEEIFLLAKREDKPFSILMLDIDYFKRINDNYGHLIGDEILKFVSSNIASFLRKSDVFGRYGGEEFIVALPNTTENDAEKLALKINEFIQNNIYVDKKHNIEITISIGVAEKKRRMNLLKLLIRLIMLCIMLKIVGETIRVVSLPKKRPFRVLCQ